jgi:RNA polymerase sigma-B factor
VVASGNPGETPAAMVRCDIDRSTSNCTTLRQRFTASHLRNQALRAELHRQRLVARRRFEQSRTILEDLSRRRTALDPASPACWPRSLHRPAARPDAERLLLLHAEYASSGDRVLRGELLAAYDSFAVALARRFPSRRESPEDLVQVARIGLLKALDRFDPALGRPFVAFARATITGELKRHVRDRTWLMRVPRSLQEQYLIVVQALEDLTQQLGRSPRMPELAERADLTVEQVIEALELGDANRPLSLDLPTGDGEGRLPEPGQDDRGFARIDHRELLETLLARLSDRERQVLHLRFVEERTQAEIATKIGMSQMYVSRLLTRTLARLRAWGN